MSKDNWPHKPQVENKGPLRKTLLERPRGKLGGLFFGCPRPIIRLSSLQSRASHLTTRDTGSPLTPLAPFIITIPKSQCQHQPEPKVLPVCRRRSSCPFPAPSQLPPPTGADDTGCFTGTCVPEGLKEKLSLEKPGQRP